MNFELNIFNLNLFNYIFSIFYQFIPEKKIDKKKTNTVIIN